jgi:enoyl-CoA hydratase/carnithine racemase
MGRRPKYRPPLVTSVDLVPIGARSQGAAAPARLCRLPLRAMTDQQLVSKVERRARVQVDGHVATVTLTRPEKHNALDIAMFEAILAAAEQVAAEPQIRVVVLHGEGKSFCSGLDVASLMSAPAGLQGADSPLTEPAPNRFQRVAYDWVMLPVPVIAAIQGNCLGGGLQIALGADIRIAHPDARLSVAEVKWGLIPDMALTQTLPRLVAIDVAKELTFTARVVGGEEAHRLGLVTRLADDPLAAAQELAREIAGRSPDAVRAAKHLLGEAWGAPARETLALEAALQHRLIGSPNQLAAVLAGMSGEPPQFTDPV